MDSKIILDLTATSADEQLAASCSYRHHPDNKGIESVLEQVRFALICRRCEAAPCVKACPRKALEKVPQDLANGGMLKRASMLCTGCGTCQMACPFGTILPQMVRFLTSTCDGCAGRLALGQLPLCATTARSIAYGQPQPDKDIVELGPTIAVKVAGGARWEPLVRTGAGR